MTNTKFRKRALLSSLAMLLVALVALGSATFAWFVANPTATASGLKLTTSAAPGVAVASASVLAKHQEGEAYTDAYKANTFLYAAGTSIATATSANTSVAAKDLQPASPNVTPSSNALSFGTAKANDSAHSTISSTPAWESGNAGVYEEKVYFKASSLDEGVTGPTVKQATVTITLADNNNTAKDGIKVALVSSTNELIGIWRPSSGADQKTWNGTTGLTDSTYACTVSGNAKAITTPIATSSAINNDGTTGNYITVYVYLDGEDDGVFSDNVPQLTNMVSSINVSVSTTALS